MKDGKYVVKSWEVMKKEFGSDVTDIKTPNFYFTKEMEGLLPLNRVIKVKNNKWKGFYITKDMLVGPVLKYGKKCIAWDESSFKQVVWFRSYYSWETRPVGVILENGTYTFFKYVKKFKKGKIKSTSKSIKLVEFMENLQEKYNKAIKKEGLNQQINLLSL